MKNWGTVRSAPKPLRGVEIGSFAHHTVTVRLPAIGRRALRENNFTVQVEGRLRSLFSELPNGVVRLLDDPGAPDLGDWERYLQPYLGLDWLHIPWFLAETYFYRRLLEACGYFRPGPGYGQDPYAYQKRQGLETYREPIRIACERLQGWRESDHCIEASEDDLSQWLLHNLWGNQVDLSLWPAGQEKRPDHQVDVQRQYLLVDHTREAARHLSGLRGNPRRVDLILDNAGLELVQDLLLSIVLLEGGFADIICFHSKPHPTFVSDATVNDIHQTVAFLSISPFLEVQAAGQLLNEHLKRDRLKLQDHFFWASPFSMWDLPEDLRSEFTTTALLISKGDANYRRLLGDRHWPFDTPLDHILSYLPVPLLALRVSKSQVMVGLQPGQAEKMDTVDPEWMTNGRWGLIQFYIS